VSSADRPCWCGRNIVWNMARDQSFWITSSEHQGTMPKRIFSFSWCTSGQVEDEIHYLLHCTCHANHREIFTTYLTSECQNFQNLDDKCKLIWILVPWYLHISICNLWADILNLNNLLLCSKFLMIDK
jgi:hypothetical protein